MAGSREGKLHFNVTHSHEQALLALGWDREIGVDLERLNEKSVEMDVAERFFSRGEVETLRSLPAGIQVEAFFLCWTRKEAYVKARGEGLTIPLDQFEVSLTPGQPARLLKVCSQPEETDRWSMEHLSPVPGYVGAVVAEGKDWALRCLQFPADAGYDAERGA
jgi:4'-phosphopantetheinyl transferase